MYNSRLHFAEKFRQKIRRFGKIHIQSFLSSVWSIQCYIGNIINLTRSAYFSIKLNIISIQWIAWTSNT